MKCVQPLAVLSLCLIFFCNLSLAADMAAAGDGKSILFLSGAHSNKAKVNLFRQAAAGKGLGVDQKPARQLEDTTEAAKLFESYDLIVFDGVSVRESKETYRKFAPVVKRLDSKFVPIQWLDGEELRKGVSREDAGILLDYYGNGGAENMSRMADFLNARIFASTGQAVEPPIVYPTVGIYHPSYDALVFGSLETYLRWRGERTGQKPVVGVLFQRSSIESASTQLVDETIKRLEARGALAVPFFFELSPQNSDYTPLLRKGGETFVDLIVNFRSIHWAGQRKIEFEKLGVPVMQALSYFDGDQKHWENNSQGISAGMTPFQLVLPESAGVTDPFIVAAVDRASGTTEVIDYQLQHLVDKALKVAALKHKPNGAKRLAVMVWGNRDVGASFLNIPESLRSIAARLNRESYDIPAVDSSYFTDRIDRILDPFYRSYQLDGLIEDDLAELMPVSDYLRWFNQLPEQVRKPIDDYWGEARDNFMVVSREGVNYFVLPRIRAGNLLVMRQPPRADNEEEDKRIYHKGTVPMNHYYLAAYYYARKYWGSDAIVHLGTHGSQEYLPGKERGLSLYDQGNLAVWDTPIVYPFIVDDVGEAMQTKRRGRATVVAHMTPPFAAAGLQGDLADIHELMHQYRSLDQGGVKEKTAQQIASRCVEKNLCKDIGWNREQINGDFDGFMEVLHGYLEELAGQNQPLGLHTFGELAEEPLLTSTLVQMMGREFTRRAGAFERQHYGRGDRSGEAEHAEDLQAGSDDLENLMGFKTVRDYVIGGADPSGLDGALQADIQAGRKHYENIAAISEWDHLVDFLAGNYVPVKNGGDPVRHPESLPTGFNLTGFDPGRVPTRAAYAQGLELTEQLIADYYQKHGRYPDKLAFSLWSMETMRHYGVLESQVLAAIGVRPVWSDDGRVVGSEIIPARELKRPRVDVVLSATGLYRDAFPNVMQWLAGAIREVAALREDNNSLWENTQKVKAELSAAGVDAAEAEYLSSVRIFSNASGNYGSGLGDAAIASDTWETDARLADLYLARMGYFYGEDDSRWGEKAPQGVDLYAKTLAGTDVALFSRSSNVYGLLASDDPFQYFGGLALAVRHIDGASPEMVISNLRDANSVKIESAAKFLAAELRTRQHHPRWIKEMMKEGYSGAVSMAGSVSNFFGWQVMDPNLVRGDQWQAFFEIYVEDKYQLQIGDWFEQVDPKAQAAIIERMLEASRKEYWDAAPETLRKLIERYQQLVNRHDLVADNEKLREFIGERARGFGLEVSLPAIEAPAAVLPPTQLVEGQKLEKVAPSAEGEAASDFTLYGILLACLLFVLLGAWRQAEWVLPRPLRGTTA